MESNHIRVNHTCEYGREDNNNIRSIFRNHVGGGNNNFLQIQKWKEDVVAILTQDDIKFSDDYVIENRNGTFRGISGKMVDQIFLETCITIYITKSGINDNNSSNGEFVFMDCRRGIYNNIHNDDYVDDGTNPCGKKSWNSKNSFSDCFHETNHNKLFYNDSFALDPIGFLFPFEMHVSNNNNKSYFPTL